MSKIVFVSGPSGMAKSSVKTKLESLGPVLGIDFQRVIIATSRGPRDNESRGNPWWFESAKLIQASAKADPLNYLTVQITGGDLQGLDMVAEVENKLKGGGVLWCELDVKWREQVIAWLTANKADELDSRRLRLIKVFFSPFSEYELHSQCKELGCSWEEVVQMEMDRRLRKRRAAGLDNATIEKLAKRVREAPGVLAERHTYDCIIVNHQGEESSEWGGPTEFPTGEAARDFSQFVEICRG